MNNNISQLIEKTNGIPVSYRFAYSMEGRPDIGIRGAIDGNMHNDMILVEDTAWLIAGDVINTILDKRVDSVRDMEFLSPENIVVNLRAQAGICGKIVQVDLGRRVVTEIQRIDHESGLLILA